MQKSFIGILLATCACISSCSNNKPADPQNIIQVPVLRVQQKPMVSNRTYVSDIQAIRNVELCSKVSGFLAGIYVDEGQHVKKGQLLFKIADEEFKAEVARTNAICNTVKAEARITDLEYSRVKSLVDKKIISPSELQLAVSKQKAAQARIEEAEFACKNALHKLSYTTIRAPFDGVIDRIPLKNGSLLTEGTLLTSISDISAVYAYFTISENEYLAYKRAVNAGDSDRDQVASLILADGKEYDQKGKIETVVSEFDATTGSIAFRAKFPNPRQLLKHKATGKVKLSENIENTVVVPQKATFEIQDKTYVFTLDTDNKVHMKSFVPGGRIDQYYIVQSGIVPGEKIVYEGIQNLKDGIKVTPRIMPEENLANALPMK